ncbi:osteocalcin 2-like [Drosophila guanche]|uniref:osteocalcin 2-like n=1 Tax=Drosophila guanche TaxID=7266 RepID=UPI001470A8A5|nr:osteocalcin 2-like [Drosophila guanche]
MERKRERKRLYRGLDKHERNLSSSSSSSSPTSVARQVSSKASDDPRPTTSAVAEPKRERKRLNRGFDKHERNLSSSSSSSSPTSVARQVSSKANDDPRPTTSAVAEPKRERKRLYRGLDNHELNLSSSSSSPTSVARQDSATTISSSSQSSGKTQMVVPSEAGDDPRPTSSALAADARNWVYFPSYYDSDDFISSDMSLNAVNGTRLPNIQPIPRRRETLILNKKAMDIYLAGTTGG